MTFPGTLSVGNMMYGEGVQKQDMTPAGHNVLWTQQTLALAK